MTYDVIVVGQGIAGTCICLELCRRNISFVVFDDPSSQAVSTKAAGIINPITGQRLVKSWNIDALIASSRDLYSYANQLLDLDILHKRDIQWAIDTAVLEENWIMRAADPNYNSYLDNNIYSNDNEFIKFKKYGLVTNALQIDLQILLLAMHRFLQEHDQLIKERFDARHLGTSYSLISYRDLTARHIVFCDGSNAGQNPYFDWLPHQTAKGEYLVCNIPMLRTQQILKDTISVVPMGDMCWVGATNDWTDTSDTPTQAGAEYLETCLQNMLNCEYEVLRHGAGIRPTTRDRRPFVGSHPANSRMHCLSGLGTKGASLAPFCAQALLNQILEGSALPEEINTRRVSR